MEFESEAGVSLGDGLGDGLGDDVPKGDEDELEEGDDGEIEGAGEASLTPVEGDAPVSHPAIPSLDLPSHESQTVSTNILLNSEQEEMLKFALGISEQHSVLKRWIASIFLGHRMEWTGLGRDHEKDGAEQQHDVSSLHHYLIQPHSSLSFQPYLRGVMHSRGVVQAVALADKVYPEGAPDWLLQEAVETLLARSKGAKLEGVLEDSLHGSSNASTSGASAAQGMDHTWEWCLRLRNHKLAAELALQCLQHWEIQQGIDGLTLLSQSLQKLKRLGGDVEGLPEGSEVQHGRGAVTHEGSEVEVGGGRDPEGSAGALEEQREITELVERLGQQLEQLELFKQILTSVAGKEFSDWRALQSLYSNDPSKLIRRLLNAGAFECAATVAQKLTLDNIVAQEAHAVYMRSLLESSISSGGGCTMVLRYLKDLPPSTAASSAMQLVDSVADLQQRQVIIRFLMHLKDSLQPHMAAKLLKIELGLKVLRQLPGSWQKRCAALLSYPELILESLIMNQQIKLAGHVLGHVPQLSDDAMLLRYATLALHFEMNLPLGAGSVRPSRGLPPVATSRRVSQEDGGTGRHGSVTSSSDFRDGDSSVSQDGGFGGFSSTPIKLLTGEPLVDVEIRSRHSFRSAPNMPLFKGILSMASSRGAAATAAYKVARDISLSTLCVSWEVMASSVPLMYRTLEAATLTVAVLDFAKQQIEKEMENATTQAGSDIRRLRIDHSSITLLQLRCGLMTTLLGNLQPAGLQEFDSEKQTQGVLDRLLDHEHYALAVYVAKRCGLDERPYWEKWALALINFAVGDRVADFSGAKSKLVHALSIPVASSSEVPQQVQDTALRVVEELEGTCPVDVQGLMKFYTSLRDVAIADEEIAFSADEYLQVLQLPGSRNLTSDMARATSSGSSLTPHSSQQSVLSGPRYDIAADMLNTYAPKELLSFMFRHGRFTEGCSLMYPPLSLNQIASQQGSTRESSGVLPCIREESDRDRYGDLSHLLSLCWQYGQLSTLQSCLLHAGPAGLSAMRSACSWLHKNRHLNYLREFQLALHQYDQAAVTCIELASVSDDMDAAIHHLEDAVRHMNTALVAVQQKLLSVGNTSDITMTVDEIAGTVTKCKLQMEVYQSVVDILTNKKKGGKAKKKKQAGPALQPHDYILFPEGSSSQAEAAAESRRLAVVELLLVNDFNLAFRVIYEFNMPPVRVYCTTASSLSRHKHHLALYELLKNTGGVLTDEERDQVLVAAVVGYSSEDLRAWEWSNYFAGGLGNYAERIIDMMKGTHSKVVGYLHLHELEEAAEVALESGQLSDVQLVLQEAQAAGNKGVELQCSTFLKQAYGHL